MYALKFEVRAIANGTNMFVEQETIITLSLDEKLSVDKACMIALGSCSDVKEMKIISDFISLNLLKVNNEQKFEELASTPLKRGSCRILAKKV